MRTYLFLLVVVFQLKSFGQLKAYRDTSKYTGQSTIETTTVTDQPAEYPGGKMKLYDHIMNACINRISVTKSEAAKFQFPVAMWTVDVNGNITDVKIFRTSNVPKVDAILLDVIQKLPKFTPAKLAGRIVEEDWRYPLRIVFK